MKKKTKARVKLHNNSDVHLIGVRFINGANIGKVYTYKVACRAKVFLGQPLVVENDYGTSVVVVVRIDGPADFDKNKTMHLKTITQKVAPI